MNAKALIVAAVLGAAAVLVLGVAGHPPGTMAASGSHTTTIHFREHVKLLTYVGVGSLLGSKSPANNGDYLAFHDTLADPRSARTIGEDWGSCWLLNAKTTLYYCSVDFSIFGRGQISGVGPFYGDGKSIVAPVTGGTGQFQMSRGELRGRALNQNVDDWVITLTQ